jgi:hypothetical protein
MLQLASMLPNTLLNHWNKLTGFILNTAQPSFAVSGGAITAVTSALKPKAVTEEKKKEEVKKCLEGFGMSLQLKAEVDKLMFKYAFEEDTKGANDEARLCLKSVPGTDWDACEDYEKCVRNFAEVWGKKVKEGGPNMKVNIVLPEEDMMVGEKGMRYFEHCWREENRGEGIEVEILKLKGTNHDSTANAGEGAIEKMISELKGQKDRGDDNEEGIPAEDSETNR